MTNASTAATCSHCTQRDTCFPMDLEPSQLALLDQLSIRRIRIKRGEHLFRDGDAFKALFTVRSGFFKTGLATETGHEQVTGFQMAGEMLGLDGIVTERQEHVLERHFAVPPFPRIVRRPRQRRGEEHQDRSKWCFRDRTRPLRGVCHPRRGKVQQELCGAIPMRG